MDRILHVVVGDSPWARAAIRYRRHRLAEYLSRHETTASVYWVYPHFVPRPSWYRFEALRKDLHRGRRGGPDNNICEMAIPTRRTVTLHSEVLHRLLLREVVRRVRHHPARTKVLWFTIPIYSRLLRACAWDQIVYDCSDYWAAQHADTAPKSRILARLKSQPEERIVRKSGLLFASSEHLVNRLNRSGRQAIMVEHGVDAARFRSAQPTTGLDDELPPRPRLAFVGTLKHFKIDFDMLHGTALSAPEYNFVLIGPWPSHGRSLEALLTLSNVTWLGVRDPDEIPSLLKLMDVALLPYRDVAYNHAVFPLKLFEYLAAGLPVVGCGLPSTVHYVENGVYLHTESTATEFGVACRMALSWPSNPPRFAIAREHQWEPKLEFMHQRVMASVQTAAPAVWAP